MRVVHSDQHAQQGGRCRHRQCQEGESGTYEGRTDGQGDGQGGVVAGERPVARPRARCEGRDPGQRSARAFLRDEELDGFAESVGDDGCGGRHRRSGQTGRVTAAQRAPDEPGRQQAQEQQRGFARRLQDGPGPLRPVRHSPVHRPVRPRREAPGDVHRSIRAPCPVGRQPHQGGRPGSGRRDRHRKPPAPPVPLDRIHAADRRNPAGGVPRPNGSPPPPRSSGLTCTA